VAKRSCNFPHTVVATETGLKQAAPLQFSFEPRPNLRQVVAPPSVMEVAGTVSWILAQKSSTVWTVRPDAMVYDAIKLMADKNVGALPVVQNDKLLGIISERDYTRKVILQGRSSKETRVSEIMSTDLVLTHPNESLTGCMHVMTDKRVRHLPVLEDGKLVGILSIGDALKWLISAQTATIEHLEQYITGGYPS
jgi:CBS domain-containing protein